MLARGDNMEGKLNVRGWLYVSRKGLMTGQYCPFSAGGDDSKCGDWCPLFGEPRSTGVHNNHTHEEYYTLEVCKRILEFDSFTDERG
jgi:hypothetical protein